MTKDSGAEDIKDILLSVDKRLKNIEKLLGDLQKRISNLEEREKSQQTSQETPLLYSRVLMGTLNAIREFEREHHHGVVAKQLARIRNLEPPTIYDHLSQLEEEDLILWQRGTEIGMQPFNAKFYSVRERDELLSDLPVLMSLPNKVVPVAQKILKAGNGGVTRNALISLGESLVEQKDENWADIRKAEVSEKVDESINYLLQRILIRRERSEDQDLYFAFN